MAPRLSPAKLRAIDAAHDRRRIRTVADLGGVWNVEGGYTFYVADSYSPDRVVLVDEEPTPTVRNRVAEDERLSLLEANFGSPETVERIGRVDAILLFDVLLHQVKPDWDAIIDMYAQVTDCFVIANPQYVSADHTVRLLDLGETEYLRVVPPQPDYPDLFERRDEFLPERGRVYGDIHNVWQWGIVDHHLRAVMNRLEFDMVYLENGGPWRGTDATGKPAPFPAFESHTFVFDRRKQS